MMEGSLLGLWMHKARTAIKLTIAVKTLLRIDHSTAKLIRNGSTQGIEPAALNR